MREEGGRKEEGGKGGSGRGGEVRSEEGGRNVEGWVIIRCNIYKQSKIEFCWSKIKFYEIQSN